MHMSPPFLVSTASEEAAVTPVSPTSKLREGSTLVLGQLLLSVPGSGMLLSWFPGSFHLEQRTELNEQKW